MGIPSTSFGPVHPFGRSFGDVLIGAVDGLVDGAVAGLLFAGLYNMFAGPSSAAVARR
jgi:hypothetical protein